MDFLDILRQAKEDYQKAIRDGDSKAAAEALLRQAKIERGIEFEEERE